MLKLISQGTPATQKIQPNSKSLQDHFNLIEAYFKSQRIRNHSPRGQLRQRRFLTSWFEEHGPEEGRPLYTWEAMKPIEGRRRIIDYGQTLLDTGIKIDTVRSYIGILKLYFSFIIDFPHVENSENRFERVQDRYGAIEQPVTEFDLPPNNHDGRRLGIPFDPEKLYELFSVLREHYVNVPGGQSSIRARNYTMAVLAGESGLRIDELTHLEISRDLFFESAKIQTRFAKAKRGSGKRSRVTLFTPLARDTVSYYLKIIRPKIVTEDASDFLFASRKGLQLPYSSCHYALKQMVDVACQAGFPIASHMGWHWFRRIFATRFIERFPNHLSSLVNLLGHSSAHTVHCYIRHSDAWMDNKIKTVMEGSATWPSIGD